MIREATIDDLKSLAALYKEFMIFHNKIAPQSFKVPDDSVCEDKIKYYMDSPLKYINVLCHETDNLIDGFLIYVLLNRESSGENPNGIIHINNIFVAENARHKGIGTEFINTVLKYGKEKYCNCVTVDVYPENSIARKFYEKMGMIPTTIQLEKRL